jgi:hypothetical protein
MSLGRRHPLEALSALVDGEVAATERRALEEHLVSCASCRDVLEDLRFIARATPEEGAPPVPADLPSRIRAALDGPRTARWSRGPLLAAAASLLVAGLLALLRLEPPKSTMPPAAPAAASDETGVTAEPPVASAPAAPARLEAKPTSSLRASKAAAPKSKTITTQKAPSGAADSDGVSAGNVASPTQKKAVVLPRAAMAEEKAEAPAVEAPPYRVRLLEERLMSVEAAGYACVVPLSLEDAGSLAAIVRASAVKQEGAVPAAAPLAPSSVARGGVGSPQAAVVAPRGCAQLSPDDCRFVLALVRDRYRAVLEQRCGPPPR